MSAWRRHQITTEASPSKISRALAAVTLMYQLAELRSLSTGPHLLAR